MHFPTVKYAGTAVKFSQIVGADDKVSLAIALQ